MANFSVKSADNMLAYEKEELRQLEKMYKADDLVEETEEIVLKRAPATTSSGPASTPRSPRSIAMQP